MNTISGGPSYALPLVYRTAQSELLQSLQDNIPMSLPAEDKARIRLVLQDHEFRCDPKNFVQRWLDSQGEEDMYLVGETGALNYLAERLGLQPKTNRIDESDVIHPPQTHEIHYEDFPLDPRFMVLNPQWVPPTKSSLRNADKSATF